MLIQLAFDAIAAKLVERSADIATIAQTQYSFEEWAIWEAILACKTAGLVACPRPRYSDYIHGSKLYGDIRVSEPTTDQFLIVEIATLYNQGTKWVWKANADTEKLRLLTHPNVLKLQLFVMACLESSIEVSYLQKRLIPRIAICQRPTKLLREVNLGREGKLKIIAWQIEP